MVVYYKKDGKIVSQKYDNVANLESFIHEMDDIHNEEGWSFDEDDIKENINLDAINKSFMILRYAGIGSRKTPTDILKKMNNIAVRLASEGYMLCSGGAIGADTAFESGSDIGAKDIKRPRSELKNIFKAEDATPDAIALASTYHPAWSKCDNYVKKLHARNMMIILGTDLNSPVEFIICWTPKGEITGGTGQALRVAKAYGIAVFNLATNEFTR